MASITEYVAGFLFSDDRSLVALIRKNKPAWQRGLLNGIGGKVEAGETAAEAMYREFHEETGVGKVFWEQFASLGGDGYVVHFFRAFSSPRLGAVTSMEREVVGVYPVKRLKDQDTIPNLRWLVPMALSMDIDRAESYVINEVITPLAA